MTTLKTKIAFLSCCVFTLSVLAYTPAKAVTPEEIEASIEAGVNWLVAQQNPDGSWGQDYYSVASTGFAVIKLEELAFEMESNPFDPAYSYKAAVEAGLNYIFRNTSIVDIMEQPAGNPDRDGDGKGVVIGGYAVYNTGICMMAIAASRAPDRVVGPIGSAVDGWTYKQVLDDMVDWMVYAQIDLSAGGHRGGWRYWGNDSSSDNSNTGYAVLGLAYAQDPTCGFNCAIPQFVKNELSLYVDYIQTDGGADDGGSGYSGPGSWVNILKTGNLIFEMTFAGFPVDEPRLQRALGYLGRRWNDASRDPGWKGPPPHYQSMYCVMKGLTYADIETIMVDGSPVNWYNEFAEAIVSNQQPDGRWPSDLYGGAVLATEWALLTLEKIAPPVPEPFGQWVYQSSSFDPCNLDDYVSGTGPFTWTHEPTEHVRLTIGPGNVLTIDYDHTWYGEEVVKFTVTDATGLSADVYATFTVIGVPIVGDIPDQTTPFKPFDLDDYLLQMKPGDVNWTSSTPPPGWTVEIDDHNVVTVTAPEGATESATITFTATNAVCPDWWLAIPGNVAPSDSDEATFIPKKPMKSFLIEKAEIGRASNPWFGSNTFVISGNFELPQSYQRGDLDKSAALSILIAGSEGEDKVAVRDLGGAWLYERPLFGDDSSGQGIDITKLHIVWSHPKNSFSIDGELFLKGIGPDTQPREAMVTLELGGKPPVVGKQTIGFQKVGNIWYYGANPTSVKPVADGTTNGQLGSGIKPTTGSGGSGGADDQTNEWDAWLDDMFYFEYIAPSEDPWLDEPLYFEDPATLEDPWRELPDYEEPGGSEDPWLDMLLYEDLAVLDDLRLYEPLWPQP